MEKSSFHGSKTQSIPKNLNIDTTTAMNIYIYIYKHKARYLFISTNNESCILYKCTSVENHKKH